MAKRTEHQHNPRKPSSWIAEIASNIAALSLSSPVLVDAGAVIAGAMRVQAARTLKLRSLAVVELFPRRSHEN